MRYKIIFFLFIITISVYSQSFSDDALLREVIQKIKSDQAMDMSCLDINQQQKIINYLKTYATDSNLYMNIDNLFGFIWDSFFSSSRYNEIRQEAANLLLDIYRIGIASDGGFWFKKAKREDFNAIARKKIMNILKAVPFTDIEKELLLKNELRIQRISYSKDTLIVREYLKKSTKTIQELRDSLATAVAIDNINNLSPKKYVLPGMILLAAWLDMKETIPIIEEKLKHENYESTRDDYKLALARLGNVEYEAEILKKPNIAYDFSILCFLGTNNILGMIINTLKEDTSSSYSYSKGGIIYVNIPYICEFLRFQEEENLIMDFPFKYDFSLLGFDCKIGNEEKNKIIKWLEENRDRIKINRDCH